MTLFMFVRLLVWADVFWLVARTKGNSCQICAIWRERDFALSSENYSLVGDAFAVIRPLSWLIVKRGRIRVDKLGLRVRLRPLSDAAAPCPRLGAQHAGLPATTSSTRHAFIITHEDGSSRTVCWGETPPLSDQCVSM